MSHPYREFVRAYHQETNLSGSSLIVEAAKQWRKLGAGKKRRASKPLHYTPGRKAKNEEIRRSNVKRACKNYEEQKKTLTMEEKALERTAVEQSRAIQAHNDQKRTVELARKIKTESAEFCKGMRKRNLDPLPVKGGRRR